MPKLIVTIIVTILVMASTGLAQSSADGSFSVHHAKDANFSLKPAQMREAESIYQSACAVVRQELRAGSAELHPHFTVVIGVGSNEVHAITGGAPATAGGQSEIWMKKWSPVTFAQGVAVLAFDQILTRDMIKQLGYRTIQVSHATVDVDGLK